MRDSPAPGTEGGLDVRRLFEPLPEWRRFPTVDEMHAELSSAADRLGDAATLRRVGTSRLGEPLRVLTLGGGPRNAVVVGGPHPNEPIGALTVGHLVDLLGADPSLVDELGFTWHFIPCIDPDGARLNEGWYVAPSDRERYARHFYRPAMDEQVEWTFPHLDGPPYFDRVLPETQALMRVLDEVRPELLYSLHNFEYGGMYWYLGRADEELATKLAWLAEWQGLPLHRGEPEIPGLDPLVAGVYQMPTVRQLAESIEAEGGDPAGVLAGSSSAEYAARYGTQTLVSEVPYWRDPRFEDESPTGVRWLDALARSVEDQREMLDEVRAIYATAVPALTIDSPFRRALLHFLDFIEAKLAVSGAARPDPARPATVAQATSLREKVHMWRLRLGGLLLRVLDGELAVGNVAPSVRRAHDAARPLLDRWCVAERAELGGTRIPLGRLVAVEAAAALIAADHIHRRAGQSNR